MYYNTNKTFELDGLRTKGEHPDLKNRVSKTIPNQSMTARELIIRFASGLPLDGAKTPIYEGDEEMPDIDKMDNIERERYYDHLREQRKEVEERVLTARKKAEEMRREKTIQELVEKRKKEEEQKEFEEWKKNKNNQ